MIFCAKSFGRTSPWPSALDPQEAPDVGGSRRRGTRSRFAEVMPNSSAWMVAYIVQPDYIEPLAIALRNRRAKRLLGDGHVEDHMLGGVVEHRAARDQRERSLVTLSLRPSA